MPTGYRMPSPRNRPVPRFAPEGSITLISALDISGGDRSGLDRGGNEGGRRKLRDVHPPGHDVNLRYDAVHRPPDAELAVADRGEWPTVISREGGYDADSAHDPEQVGAATLHDERG